MFSGMLKNTQQFYYATLKKAAKSVIKKNERPHKILKAACRGGWSRGMEVKGDGKCFQVQSGKVDLQAKISHKAKQTSASLV